MGRSTRSVGWGSVIALCAALLLSPAHAANQVVSQFALPNGMRVVVIPDHRAPVVTQMIWYRVGGMDDPPGRSGLAHFFEHMMFRGTKAVPGEGFSRTLARNGGDTNAFTTEDYTAFYEQMARDRLHLAMQLEADRMMHLDLSDSAVLTERNVVLEERRMRVDNNPQSLANEQVEAALYLSHPYGRPVIGWPDEVGALNRSDAQAFYDTHYAPNNAILVIVGDVTPEQVKAFTADTLAKVPARALAPRIVHGEPLRLGETRLTIARPDVSVPMFTRTWRVPSYTHDVPGQAEALDVLAEMMGGDPSAALYTKLVVQQNLATDAGASYDGDARDSGQFSVYAVPRPGVSLEQVERAVDAVIADFAAKAPSADDLAHIKTRLVATEIYRRDNQLSLATAYGQTLAIGLNVADVQDWPRRIQSVSADAVRDAAKRLLDRREAVSLYLKPPK
ncbi:MAG: insulinase family protein [Alphaproteobacteria bacterium]|nr:insulinase family protein [Alphaproteobacteria bacterium]